MTTKITYWCNEANCLQHTDFPGQNGWLKARAAAAFHLYPWSYASDATLSHDEEVLHLCSDSCALKSMSNWLGQKR